MINSVLNMAGLGEKDMNNQMKKKTCDQVEIANIQLWRLQFLPDGLVLHSEYCTCMLSE